MAIADVSIVVSGSEAQAQPMDEAAFRALYESTASRLRNYLLRACGDAALADDLLQETFLKLLRAQPPALEAPAFKAYLYRTATNLLTDHWRRLKRERHWSFLQMFRFEPAQAAVETVNPLGDDTARGFHELKPQEQALLWMAYVEGFDHGEIAAALELREASVRVLLFRARRRLALILKKHGGSPR